MNRRTSLLAALIIAMSAAGSASAAADEFETFRPEKGRFSIDMPGKPTTTETHQKSFIGTVTNHIFTSWDGDEKFTVDYSDIPHFAAEFAGADTIYDHAKGALLKQTFGKVVSYADVEIGKAKGKNLVYALPPAPGKAKMHGEARFFLVGTRLYVIDATVPAGDAQALARRFLDSVRFD